MEPDDVAYYRKRALAERELSQSSDNAEVAAIHEELARQYEALVDHPPLRGTLRIAVPSGRSDRVMPIRMIP